MYHGFMNAGTLHNLSRRLREIALVVTGDEGEDRISAGELAIIEDVSHHPLSAIGEIADRTRLAQSLVSRVVAAMQEAGIMTTQRDDVDRRRVLARIDPEASVQLFRARGARPVHDALHRELPNLTEHEIQRLEDLLTEVADLLGRQQNENNRG